MQTTLLGGGGFRTPLVYAALREHGVGRVVLHDTDGKRLDVVEHVIDGIRRERGGPEVRTTTDLDDALTDADFVFVAIRVGGATGRVIDERVAIEHGVLGQETTGAGGVAYGLRTVPVAVGIAERVRAICPDAWVINFTNPAGLITEAMQAVLGNRVIGICDSPAGLVRRMAQAAGAGGASRVEADYAGLNHLGWLTGLRVDGTDVLPDLLHHPSRLARTEEGRLFGTEWLQDLRMIPNEYLYYFYFTRDVIASSPERETRGEFIRRRQADFYAAAAQRPDDALDSWRATRDERDRTYFAEGRTDGAARDPRDAQAGGYEHVAVAVMDALSGTAAADAIVNVRGRGALPWLPDSAVVEIPCRIDASGATPHVVGPLRGHAAGLVQQIKQVETLTIDAAVQQSRRLAVEALALHPLVDSLTVAKELLTSYARRAPELAAFA